MLTSYSKAASSAFLTAQISGPNVPASTDPSILAAVSLWSFAAYRRGSTSGSTDFRIRLKTWLNRIIAEEFAAKALAEGAADATTTWAPSTPVPDEMTYDCDANLGAPSAVNCLNINYSQLEAPSTKIMIGPGTPKVLSLDECNVVVSANSNIVITWDQIRLALEGLLLFCVSRPWQSSIGGRAYYNPEPKFAAPSSFKRAAAKLTEPKIPRLRRKSFWIIIFGILAIVSTVVIVPVVEVSRRKSHNPSSMNRPSTTPISGVNNTSTVGTDDPSATSIPSTRGAFNGTGLSTIYPSNDADIAALFYQSNTGELQYATLSNDGNWQGGQSLGVSNAMNGTPIATAARTAGNWQVFYVNSSGMIQNTYQSNISAHWITGTIGSQSIQVPNQHTVALAIRFGIQFNSTINALDSGLALYAGGIDGLVHEYLYSEANNTWNHGFTFPQSNGYAGASVTVPGSSTTTPWLSADSISSLLPNSSQCTNKNDFYQSSNTHIMRSGWTGIANTQRWSTASDVSNATTLPGTSIGCLYYGSPGPVAFFVFWQSDASDVVVATVNWNNTYTGYVLGDWETGLVPIG
ncbi:hypothetical protein MMC14_003097 [Varicellaria rhodocarpa]|nr:hypothetical protein [Varicellaria rhodocarpa]